LGKQAKILKEHQLHALLARLEERFINGDHRGLVVVLDKPNDKPSVASVCWVVKRRPQDNLLGRQSGFRETFGNPLNVLFPLERLPAEMLIEGVFWIDLFKFLPDATGLIDLIEMTESGSH
jgi:hypothetical protein